jgi:hypothetical protein
VIVRYSIYSSDGSLPYVRNKRKDNDGSNQNTIFFITDFSLEVTSLGLPFLSFKAVPATWTVDKKEFIVSSSTIKTKKLRFLYLKHKSRKSFLSQIFGRNYSCRFTLKMGLWRT